MKGFKDSDGKFHPTENKKGIRMKRDKTIKTTGVRLQRERFETRTYKVWSFQNAPEELKQKILDKNRNINLEHDDFWADYDGIIYDKDTKISDYDVFSNYNKKYYDLDRGQYIQFPDLQIKDDKKLAKMLGIPESIRTRIDFKFQNERERNTELVIYDLGTYDDITKDTTYEDYLKYYSIQSPDIEKKLTKSEFEKIQKAIEKWSDLMQQAWVSLRNNYEYQMSDEAVKETLIANEYKFNEDGKID